jgi:tetratricopeptide (TPR) repeat protein
VSQQTVFLRFEVKIKGFILASSQTKSPSDAQFELAKLYCERGDFDVAQVHLREAIELYLAASQWEPFLESQALMMRMHAERSEMEQINLIKERLQDLVLKENFTLTAKVYYTLGVCASYKDQKDVALDYFQKSLALALSTDNKRDIYYAINGIAIVYYRLGMYQEALREIYNLQVFFQVMPLNELRLASQMLNGQILRKLKKFEQALEILWDCYEILREEKNLFMYLHLLYGMALTYKDSGDHNLARMYLQLANRSVDPQNMRNLSTQIDDRLKELGVRSSGDFDLVFDSSTNSVTEKKKGRVDFKNQFILLDLLRLFMREPGQVFSKESLVEAVWRQHYDPGVHDNKIYVTIKRLRKMIEPDFDKPKYIFRAKNGYYLSKNTRVLLDS